ncbi:MAG: tRNA pseudouridine(55) synthase TruB [Nitrospiraceae bacterium]
MPSPNGNSGVLTGKSALNPPVVGDGILNINKPMGWTSHDVVAKIRRVLKGVKTGHAGTLDPAATGVLPVLIGQGTRIAEYLLDWDKEYDAVFRLGETTDTQDATGTLLMTRSCEGLAQAQVQAVIDRFKGPVTQMPPMYSAVKVGGVPLYKVARSGRTVERDVRQVVIHRLDMTAMVGCDVSLRVTCSKGTYIRTLCADIGDALGVGGHLLALERRRVGPLPVTQALTIEAFSERLLSGRLEDEVMSLDHALSHLPAFIVDEPAAARLIHGVPVPWAAVEWDRSAPRDDLQAGLPVRLKDPRGRLLAVGRAPGAADGSPVMKPEPSSDQSFSITKVLVHV